MPKILDIKINPDKTLRKVSEEIKKDKIKSAEFKNLTLDLVNTMLAKDGIGLAAPQTGKNIRLISVNTKDGPIIMINPKIIKKSLLKEWGEEGCLSVPMTFGEVKRYKGIKCVFRDLSWKERILPARGLLARCLQHEIDHLDGVLFIDKAKNLRIIDLGKES